MVRKQKWVRRFGFEGSILALACQLKRIAMRRGTDCPRKQLIRPKAMSRVRVVFILYRVVAPRSIWIRTPARLEAPGE